MKSGRSRPSLSYRTSWKRFRPRPERTRVVRNCFGMMRSVSTLTRSSGAAMPVRVVKGSISGSQKATHIGEVARHGGGGGHAGAHQMRAAAAALAAFEVAVAGAVSYTHLTLPTKRIV